MKTVNIKGKEYVEVNERLKEFRNNFKDYSLTTEVVELTPEYCVLKAVITDDKGIIRATGLAQESRESSFINKTSYVENCETSAWGRALGNFGIGIDSAICSADELIIALDAQSQQKNKPEKSDFEKQAAAEKTARTKALKAGNEAPAPKQTLEERYQAVMKYIYDNKNKPFTPSVTDRINAVINDLFAADRIDEATNLNALMKEHAGIADDAEFLDQVINGTADFNPNFI